MAHQFKHKSSNKKWLFILSIAICLVIGIIAFVLAYGLTAGWDAVASWFTGKYAVLLYICVGSYAAMVGIIFAYERYKRL